MLLTLPFDFEREGNLDFLAPSSSSSSYSSLLSGYYSHPFELKRDKKEGCFLGGEPSSVLDTIASPTPSPPTSTLSGGGGAGGAGSTDTAGVAAISGNPSQKWPPLQQDPANCLNVGVEISAPPAVLDIATAAAAEKCGLGMENWETMLTETAAAAASPSQEQSIIRWIMGDMDDPSLGLNKLLQSGGGGPDHHFDFNGCFGSVDQGFGLDPDGSGGGNLAADTVNHHLPISSGFTHKFGNEKLGLAPPNPSPPLANFKPPNPIFSPFSQRQQALECADIKPQIFNPQLLINHHQAAQNAPNPAFFLPLQYAQQQDPHLVLPPQAKRHNLGGAEPMLQPQPQLLPQYLQPRPAMGVKPKPSRDEMGHQQQAIVDQIYKAAELVQAGNSVHAHGILARLNHQLTPIGKPFHRAAFFCKEALQLLLHQHNTTLNPSSPFNLIMKIGAYKSFSEISPLLQFANFTCNQALLEVLEGFDRIHIVDFDIGYGGQWASLMQELAMRSGGAPSLRITAFTSPSTHDQLELGLTRENLNHFAGEINMAFEFNILSLDSLNSASWSLPIHVNDNEAVAVNLPVGSFSNYQLPLPLVLRLVKQLSPKIMVSVDRGCDRTDLPFANHVIHALHSYSNLLESLDAEHMNLDALQKIERFLLQPGIEKIVVGRFHSLEKTPHWRTLFLSSGFSPVPFSNFTESQAECVIKRTPVRGFHFEKRQSSLVLCWQRKELISVSAWRC